MSDLLTRLKIVEEHVRQENAHDLDGIMTTFGPWARYEDESWRERHEGQEKVRRYYEDLLRALPDLAIEVKEEYVAGDRVIQEVVIRGTHEGFWRGLPGTGKRLEFPLCSVYAFDHENRISAERIYYDRATVMAQLGLLHDPLSLQGKIVNALTHPLTMLGSVLHTCLKVVSKKGKQVF